MPSGKIKAGPGPSHAEYFGTEVYLDDEEPGNSTPQIPGTEPGSNKVVRRRRDITTPILAILAILALTMPFILSMQHPGTDRYPAQHSIPAPPREHPWVLYEDVAHDMTLSGRDLTILGDIIVEKGATLDISGCNITMNGTFYVEGNLKLRDTRMQNFPEKDGFDLRTSWIIGVTPSLYQVCPAFITNLTDCRWAWLNFSARYDIARTVGIDVLREGIRTMSVANFTGENDVSHNVSVDISEFCGGVARLEFVTAGYVNDFEVMAPKIETDRFRTATEDLILDLGNNGVHMWEYYLPYAFRANGGNISIEGCSLVRQPSDNDLISAVNSTIRISSSDFLARPAGPGHQTCIAPLLNGDGCAVRVDNSSFWGSFGIYLNNSRADIDSSHFGDQSGQVVSAVNTVLVVTGCRIDSCQEGISGMIDTPGAGGSVTVRRTSLDCRGLGIGLKGIPAIVEGCSIRAQMPFIIYPDSGMSRQDCRMETIAAISGNSIEASGYRWGNNELAAMCVFSAIPVAGIEGVLRNNTWNATLAVARCIYLETPNRNTDSTQVSFERAGRRVDFDPQCSNPVESRVNEGLDAIPSRSYFFWGHPSYELLWDYGRVLPMDRYFCTGAGFSLLELGEANLSFTFMSDDGIGEGVYDARMLRHPGDMIRIGAPSSTAAPRRACDLSIHGLRLSYDGAISVVNVSMSMENLGVAVTSINLSWTLNGREMERWTSGPWDGDYTALSIDRQNLTPGELTVRAVPSGMEDVNLSNNEVRGRITLVNQSLVIDKHVDLGGLWILGEGTDLTIRNCECSMNDTGAVIQGLGGNGFVLENSTVNLTSLSVNVSSGIIRDTDLIAVPLSIEYYHYPDYGPQIELLGGSWEIHNVTAGCRAMDFEGIRQLVLSDPMNYSYYWIWGGAAFNFSVIGLTVDAVSLDLDHSNLLLGFADYIIVDSLLRIENCSLDGGAYFLVDAGEVLFRNSRFEWYMELMLESPNATMQGNMFKDGWWSLDVANLSFTNNSVVSDLYYGYGSDGLRISMNETSNFSDNTFSGWHIAILLQSPKELPDIARTNRFTGLTGAEMVRQKTITLEFLHDRLELMLNREVSNVTVFWNDGISDMEAELSMHYLDRGDTQNWSMNVYDWVVDVNGTGHRFGEARCRLVVASPSGATSELELAIPFRDEDAWTIPFG
jgi:hypothetical protein